MRIIDLIDELELNNIYVSLEGEDIELSFEGEEIDQNLLDKIKENKQELVGFLQKSSSNNGYQKILPSEKRAYYPVSHNQKRIWVLSQFEGGSVVWNMPLSIPLKGTYSQEILNKAIESVIERHEILRTVFKKDDNGEPYQLILSPQEVGFKLDYKNFLEEANPGDKAYAEIKNDSDTPFDLENGPLIRTSLFQTAQEEYIFYLNIHHIISDGWSLEILFRDILLTYESISLGETPDLPSLSIQYKDFTAWQLNQVQDPNFEKHRAFWKNELSGELPVLELPSSKLPPKTMTYNGHQLRTYIEPNLTKDLKSLSKELGGSLFIQLLSAWNILLHRYLNQKDIIIGTLVAGREQPELENQIGYYVNTLSLRNTIISGESFTELFKRVKENTLTAFAHQSYPFDSLLEELDITRDMSRTPIFDILLVLHNIKEQHKEYKELDQDFFDKTQDMGTTFSKFPIELEFKELGDYLSFDVKFNTDIHDKEVIENLIKHYKKLLSEIVQTPEININKINFLEEEERNKLLYSFNDTKMSYPDDKSIIDIFEEQVQKTPQNIAVIYKENQLTFSELNSLANKYAQALSKSIGLKSGDKIIVSLVHDHKLLAVLLAIKKVGAIYVPVDPQTPEERIKYIQVLSESIAIVDNTTFAAIEQQVLKIDNEITNWNRPEQNEIEFIIYTSGSTGIPKGVLIKSSSVNNRLNWMWSNYPFEENEVCCAKTSISFVDHIWEFFGPLLKGIPLVFYRKEEIIDVINFIKSLSSEKVTRIVLVPSLLRAMLSHAELCKEKLNKLNIWISSGEALKKRDVDTFYEVLSRNDVRLLNIYGSTEVTADATYYDTYDDYNLRKPFSLFDSSIKDNIDELISSYDTSLQIVSNSFEQLLEKNIFKNIDFKANGNPEDYMKFLKTEIIPNIINVGVPKYIGHMTGPIPKFIRQLNELITVLNQNQVKIETSMAATLIEKQVVGIFHKLVYEKDQEFYDQYIQDPRTPLGVVTNGGTMSNIMAMSYTLNNALKAKDDFRGLTEEGLLNAMKFYGYEKIVLLGSTWCHYSFGKALKMLGLGKESFIALNFQGKESNSVREELRTKIEELKSENALILGIVGIAGTTESGNIDPLPVLGEVAATYNIHFHVDASFGGSFLVDDELRKKFTGIEYANSVSICAHKQLYIPIGLSICVFKDPGFALSSENNTHYQARKGSYDLGKFTVEGSRNFMTLTLHAVFHVFGKEGFAEIIRHNYSNAQYFAEIIKSSNEFRLLYQPDLNIVLYRYIPVDLRSKEKFTTEELIAINELNRAIHKDQFERGKSFISYTEIQMQGESERHLAFRTVFMNPYTTHNDLKSILEEQKIIAAKLEGKTIDSKTFRNESILIGKPIENVKVYILDEFLNLLPIGVTGEICVSGDCISAGYINLLEDSLHKFVEDPFAKGERLFRTGDLGRRLADGNIEFVARKDDQVKIRGHRIELGEIETALLQFSDTIKQVVAETKEVNEEKVLVVYYVSQTEVDKTEIRNYLQSKLPDYMVPGFYVTLQNLPLTSSGKIDRKALPNVTDADIIRKAYQAPSNELEEQLVTIWQEILKVEKVGVTDNFFELGGNSLFVVRIINKIQKQLNKTISFKSFFSNLTIEKLAVELKDNENVFIPAAPVMDNYPLAASQSRLWILSQLEGGSSAYNMPVTVKFIGEIDILKFQESFNVLIKRHEILRTKFKANDEGEIRQHILPVEVIDFKITEEDFTGEANQKEAVINLLQEKRIAAFDLEDAPLLRANLIKLNKNEHVFFLTIHHIISDGWSTKLLVTEIVKIYNALTQNKDISLPVLGIQYKDYSVWLNEELQQEKHQQSKEFWLKEFEGELPVLNFPGAKKRPLVQTYNGKNTSHSFSREFTGKLKTYSKNNGTTLFMTLMAGVKTMLYKYTNQQDIIVGTPIAGREHSDLENQIGLYLNTLAVRTKFEEKNSFTEILKREKETLLGIYQHQNYPFDELIHQLNIKRDTSRSALFDIMVVLHNQANLKGLVNEDQLNGLQVADFEFENTTSQFDISFNFLETDTLILNVEYNTDIYNASLIERMLFHFETIITNAIEAPNKYVEDIDYLSKKEKYQVLEIFNDTTVDYSKTKTIIDIFEEQVKRTPDNVAVVFEDKELTYKELNDQANQLGSYLRENYAIKPNDLVAIKLERSERLIVAIYGILKSGAAYVPIDSSYPQERIEYIENDTKSKIIIDEKELALFFNQKEGYSSDNPDKINDERDLAYVIYTSGTTGNPKGVMIEHTALVNRLEWMQKAYALSNSDVILQKTSYSFDVSVWELFWWSFTGSKVCMLKPEGQKSPKEIIDHIEQYKVSVLHFVPSMLTVFLNYLEENQHEIQKLKSLVRIFVSGEALTVDQNNRFFISLPDVSLVNLYGPTEATIDVSYFECSENLKLVPIGKPIDNTKLYILNNNLQPVLTGAIGKLYISGSGLARGYLNKSELTAEKFIPNPFAVGEKMYDTGDLASWLPDGNIEYKGRNDHQIKIRGFRIELGEIETALSQFSEAIKQAVVVVKELNREKTLVAYYVSTSEIDKAELRNYLAKKLPEYMVPAFYVALEFMPLTSNGKIDTKAFPNITGENSIRKEFVAPANETEQKLVEIWQEVLGIDKIGVTDNFFELGGHSIKAIKIISKTEKIFNVKIYIGDVFEDSTIKGMADKIDIQTWYDKDFSKEEITDKVII